MSIDQFFILLVVLVGMITCAMLVMFVLEIRRRSKRDAQPFKTVWENHGVWLEESEDGKVVRLRDNGEIVKVYER